MTERFDAVRAAMDVARKSLLLAMAMAGGCVPDFPGGAARDPNTDVPASYMTASSGGEASTADSTGASTGAGAGTAAPAPGPTIVWREFFADGSLAGLIDEALANNQELNISIQEMIIANNEIMARRGDILPSASIGVSAGVEHVGEQTSQGQADQNSGLPSTLQNYSVGLYASWEVDVWRRLRNLRDAAIQRYLASVEGRNFIITRLVAEIAISYYELMALDQQLEVIRTNIELQTRSLEMVQLQFQAAASTSAAVARFEAELARYQAQEFPIRQRIVETENRLNFLVGRFPRPISRPSATFLDIVPPAFSGGTPGELLQNRPDIRQAELLLEATRFDVRAARARYYPSLRLDAGVGYQSVSARRLFSTPSSLLFGILGSIAAPLLNRRGITAAYFTANAEQQRAVLVYERSILGGYLEVVNRMNMIVNSTQALELKKLQVERLNASIEASILLFNSARANYLEVLTARRDSLEAQLQLIEIKQQQLSASVGVYQALGGGWR
jgi:multidrug efflux system outer membrane protein